MIQPATVQIKDVLLQIPNKNGSQSPTIKCKSQCNLNTYRKTIVLPSWEEMCIHFKIIDNNEYSHFNIAWW